MPKFEDVLKQLEAHGAAFKGLEAIGDITRDALTSSHHETAAAALSAIMKIIEVVLDAFDGKSTPQDVAEACDTAIHDMLDRLASNDAKHDHQLEELDKGDGNG